MAEDFNQLKLLVKQLVKTPFQEGWQYRLDIEGAPDNFDIYTKEINFGPIEIETDHVKAGIQTLTYPVGTTPTNLSVTVRDHQDRRIYDWFTAWASKVINDDGTVNLPSQYKKKVERINLVDNKIKDTWFMYPTKLGDIAESVDSQGFLEFPLTFIQFRSWGE